MPGEHPLKKLPTPDKVNAYQVPIRQWDEGDRPRERLLKHGAAILSDAELIALIFGTGARLKRGPISAVQLGRATLRAFGSLRSMSTKDMRAVLQVTGIGKAKAAQLIAAFEIGRRVESQQEETKIQVKSPEDVAAVFGPLMRDLKREIFKIVLLNTANIIIADYTISEGGLAASIVEPRAVFQKAVLDNAAAIICLHNHPSGNLEPSREDIRVTRQLVEAGKIMGIPVHDHLIIAGRGFTSLADRGLLSN